MNTHFLVNAAANAVIILCLVFGIFLVSACESCTSHEDYECRSDGSFDYIRFRFEGNDTYIKNYHESRPISVRFQTACLPVTAGWKTVIIEPNERKFAYTKYDDHCTTGRGHVTESICTKFDR